MNGKKPRKLNIICITCGNKDTINQYNIEKQLNMCDNCETELRTPFFRYDITLDISNSEYLELQKSKDFIQQIRTKKFPQVRISSVRPCLKNLIKIKKPKRNFIAKISLKKEKSKSKVFNIFKSAVSLNGPITRNKSLFLKYKDRIMTRSIYNLIKKKSF